jgi:hypothetical protein
VLIEKSAAIMCAAGALEIVSIEPKPRYLSPFGADTTCNIDAMSCNGLYRDSERKFVTCHFVIVFRPDAIASPLSPAMDQNSKSIPFDQRDDCGAYPMQRQNQHPLHST